MKSLTISSRYNVYNHESLFTHLITVLFFCGLVAVSSQTFGQFQADLLSGAAGQYRPATDGQHVVWEDNSSGATSVDVVIYSLAAGTDITPDPTSRAQGNADVDQGIAIWHDYRNKYSTGWDIYGYDINSGQPLTICTESGHQENPKIDYPIAVWQDERGDDADILGWDFSQQQPVEICTAEGNQFWADIHGDWVVWQDYRNGNWDIYAYNFVSETEMAVCTDANEQTFPRVCGDLIVWHDNRAGNYDIYGYDLVNSVEIVICDDPGNQYHPVASADYIAWEDWRNNAQTGIDLYGLARSSGTEFDVIKSAGDQVWPDLEGNFLVYEDNGDIYSVELSDPPSITVLSPNGSEEIPAKGSQEIQWQSEGLEGNVEIEYTIDGGVNYAPIATAAITAESVVWAPVADANSMNCRIRVTSVELPEVSDESDGEFWVFPCDPGLTADFNRDCYVDVKDMAFLMAQWLDCGHPTDPTWCAGE